MTIDTPALHRALDTSLAYGATYSAGALRLSNHLPMMLTALWRLGAPSDSLKAALQRASRRLESLDASSAQAVAAREIAADIERDGIQTVLAGRLPGLLLAAETAAFHGLIRLSYALAAGHLGEIAQALAAWHATRASLGPPVDRPLNGTEPSIATTLRVLSEGPALACAPRSGTTITGDMRACVDLPGFGEAVDGPQAPVDAALTLDALAEASLAVYLSSRNFTALHLVTACHAWRLVEPHAGLSADQARIARRGLWRAWLGAWISIGRRAADFEPVHAGSADEADWRAALPELAASPDEHRVKLAWTALDEWRHRGWPGYAGVLRPAKAAA
jgi:Questin oxidase-like